MSTPDAAISGPTARAVPRLYSPRVFSKRARQRFAANRTAELRRHLGREPSYPERIIISRVIAIEWELRRLDARLDSGDELSGHAMRARLAAETRLRLDLQALGLRDSASGSPGASDLTRATIAAHRKASASG